MSDKKNKKEEAIKACPFCPNTNAFSVENHGEKFVRCNLCLATGPFESSKAKAIAAWNRRV